MSRPSAGAGLRGPPAATYRGTVHAFRTVVRARRLGLSGLTPARRLHRRVGGVLQLLQQRRRDPARTTPAPEHLHLSAPPGWPVVSLATNPIWVVKTRLQLQSRGHGAAGKQPRALPGFIDALTRSHARRASRVSYRDFPLFFLVSHGAIQFTATATETGIAVETWRVKVE